MVRSKLRARHKTIADYVIIISSAPSLLTCIYVYLYIVVSAPQACIYITLRALEHVHLSATPVIIINSEYSIFSVF